MLSQNLLQSWKCAIVANVMCIDKKYHMARISSLAVLKIARCLNWHHWHFFYHLSEKQHTVLKKWEIFVFPCFQQNTHGTPIFFIKTTLILRSLMFYDDTNKLSHTYVCYVSTMYLQLVLHELTDKVSDITLPILNSILLYSVTGLRIPYLVDINVVRRDKKVTWSTEMEIAEEMD